MARPAQRLGSDKIQYRARIPADVKRILDGLPEGYRPKGWGKNEITITTGEADKRKAAAEHSRIAAEVQERFSLLRAGVRHLSQKDAVALAGTIYKAFAEGLEDNPGSHERWQGVLAMNAEARAGKFGRGPLMIGQEAQLKASMEGRFGGFVDAVLGRECIIIDNDSRALLLKELARALDLAAQKLKRNAESDYSPDETAKKFPLWEPKAEAKPSGKKLTLGELFEKWEKHPEQAQQPASTISRYRGVFEAFSTFLNDPDVNSITDEDAKRYAEARMQDNLSPKTVKNVHKVALSSVFNWAKGKGLGLGPITGVGKGKAL